MGISRVVVKATHIGQIEEEEGMVTVNYGGGQVSKQNQKRTVANQSKSASVFHTFAHCALPKMILNIELCHRSSSAAAPPRPSPSWRRTRWRSRAPSGSRWFLLNFVKTFFFTILGGVARGWGGGLDWHQAGWSLSFLCFEAEKYHLSSFTHIWQISFVFWQISFVFYPHFRAVSVEQHWSDPDGDPGCAIL